MEIIIRVNEERQNLTVASILQEMASDAWVKKYLPQLVEAAKAGETRKVISTRFHENTARTIKESFSKLGIKVSAQGYYHSSDNECYYREITFSWS